MNHGDFVRCIDPKVDTRYPDLGLILNAVYGIEAVNDYSLHVVAGAGPILAAKARFIPWDPQPGDWIEDTQEPHIGIKTVLLDRKSAKEWVVSGKPYGLCDQVVDSFAYKPVLGVAPSIVLTAEDTGTFTVKIDPGMKPTISFDTTQNRLRKLESALRDDPCPDPEMIREYRLLTSEKPHGK